MKNAGPFDGCGLKTAFQKTRYSGLMLTVLLLSLGVPTLAQNITDSTPDVDNPNYGVVPWTEGTLQDALQQAASGATIPMSLYPFASTKDKTLRIISIVGADPIGPVAKTIDVVVIPVKIFIGADVFDPTAPNSCDGGVSALTRFKQSPLVVATKQVFNGVNVGSYQYINGFMRAEFWKVIGGSPNYSNTLKFKYAPEMALVPGPSFSITNGTGCSKLGVINGKFLDDTVNLWIPLLQGTGVISPTKLAVFLLNNVVQSSAVPPSIKKCCTYGYHGAVGTPVQTYSPMDYDTTGRIPKDVSVPAHEFGEWMNDPLGKNATPKWGHIGQVSGCQGNFEVGDPLTGTNMPTIKLSGHDYHVQELAFFSWYYNADTTPSVGAGGKFSGNGTFKGPSKVCPPGGTF
jgi:hypothetical protein